MNPAEQIIQTLSMPTKVGLAVNFELCVEKLDSCISLLGLAGAWEAECLRELAKERINLIESAGFKPYFKSARELDRHLDELCPATYSNYSEAKRLNENLNSAIDGLRTLVSALK